MEPTILIIGAGTFGTSTAYHLASTYSDPSKITIIDRNDSPPEHAAAIDINRIIRTDYAKPLYCDLANEALHSWTWSLELQRFFHKTGWLVLGEEGSKLSENVRGVFRERGFDQTVDVGLDEIVSRWVGLRETDVRCFGDAYFNPEAGWVEAARATWSFMRAAERKGVKRVVGEVAELIWDDEKKCLQGVRLADGDELTADRIVLAAGAWTSSLLSPIEDKLAIAEQDRIERQAQATAVVSAYFKLSPEEAGHLARPKNLPIVVYGKQGEVIPPSESQDLLKYNLSAFMFTNTVTTKAGCMISEPTTPKRSQYDVPARIKREMETALTSKLLPEYVRDKEPNYWRICWDACTPTEDLLMCRHTREELKNLFIAVGGTFSGYK
jgi:sarcosine oxidase/L-pipecolate oxidase